MMETLLYYFIQGGKITIVLCGFVALIGLSMLVGWGLAWTVARIIL